MHGIIFRVAVGCENSPTAHVFFLFHSSYRSV